MHTANIHFRVSTHEILLCNIMYPPPPIKERTNSLNKIPFLIIYLIINLFFFLGCDLFNSGNSGGGSSDDPEKLEPPIVTGNYSREFWGEWIRMDTGERWYITQNSITVNGSPLNRIVTPEKTSDQVTTVKEQGKPDFLLFASRVANGSFNARIVKMDNDSMQNKIARSIISGEGYQIITPSTPGLVDEPAYSDDDTGEIIVTGIIPGDPVIIIPNDDEWKDVNVGGTPEDGQDMGSITLTKGVNLKTTIRMANPNENIALLYADGTTHNFLIEIENIGTTDTTGASYELIMNDAEKDINFNRDFILNSGNVNGVLDTIRPGDKRQIHFSLGSRQIEEGRKYKKIGIRITSFDTVLRKTKIWDDVVSINYYKMRIPFRFKSDKPVQGVIKAPGGSTYYFKTQWDNNGYSYSINVPWSSEDYIVAFLGASVDAGSETRYSIGINAQPPSNWNSLFGADLFLYEEEGSECNENENTAPVLDLETNKTFMGYLHNGDIDFYRINLGDVPPELMIADMEDWAIGEVTDNYLDGNVNPGDTINLDAKFVNYSNESITLTMTGLAADSAYASYFNLVSLPSYKLILPPEHYGSLTSYSTSAVSANVQMLNESYLNRAFRFKLLPDAPEGKMTLTLTFSDNTGAGYNKSFDIDVVTAPVYIVLDDYDSEVSIGSNNLNIWVKNAGTENTAGVTARLLNTNSSYSSYISINGANPVTLGDLTAGGASKKAVYQINIGSGCPVGVEIPLRVEFKNNNNNTWYGEFNIIVLPPGPANVSARALSETSIRVTWNAVSGAAGYKVYSDDGELLTAVSGDTRQYDHTGLAAGTVYTFRVSAVISSGSESAKSAASARTWERLVFNKTYNRNLETPHYYRFYAANGINITLVTYINRNISIRWEDNNSLWFDHNGSSVSERTADRTGWAYFELTGTSAYSFRITASEAAVSSFLFPGVPVTGEGLSEIEKTVKFKVPYGTNLSSLTPSIISAPGWTCLTTGAQNFNTPVEYVFSNGNISQVYTVTITPDGQGGIIVNPPPAIDDEYIPGFPVESFTLSRTASGGNPSSLSFTLASTNYSSIEWWVGNIDKSNEAANNRRTFVVQASAYTIGKHTLTVVVYVNGIPYSSYVDFSVVQ